MKPRTANRGKVIALRRSTRLHGECELRRSSRLTGKCAMTVPKQTSPPPKPCKVLSVGKSAMPKLGILPSKGKPAITKPESTSTAEGKSALPKLRILPSKGKPAITKPESTSTAEVMQKQRVYEARQFLSMYKKKNDCPEQKTFILPCGSSKLIENSFGITYVAVRGEHFTCVAFKKTMETIRDRICGYLVYHHKDITYDFLARAIISEIEVGEHNHCGPSTKRPCSCCRDVHKRFAIVSVVPNAENNNGENANKVAAVDYLTGIIEKDEDFYPSEAELVVIKALQFLLNEDFTPQNIWVHEACLGKDEGMRDYQLKYRLDLIKNNVDRV